MAIVSAFASWLDRRLAYRAVVDRWRDVTPHHVHWAYTLGALLLLGLVVQGVTGLVLMLYYVPTPTHAYDSVRYVVSEVPFGRLLRGLHHHGASVLPAVAVLHLLRTLVFGAYKAPREATWLSGLLLLALIVAFGLTGYLLPWDQLGYAATVVRANIASTTPIVGPWVARLMRGGDVIGAVTLSRWYGAHVGLLPLALVAFTAVHVRLVRLHGRAGHYRDAAPPRWPARQGARSALVVAAAFAVLLWVGATVEAPLGAMADPADVGFVPHPEWYFLWLFQLMKYTTGGWEQVGAPMVLAAIGAFLVALPWLDGRPERALAPRTWVLTLGAAGLVGIAALTAVAVRDTPPDQDPRVWSPVALAGLGVAERDACRTCHGPEGVAPDLGRGRVGRDNAWIRQHLSDPEALAPGRRPIPFDAPTRAEIGAVVAYQRTLRAGGTAPAVTDDERRFARVYTAACASCHRMDGDGVADGPDLTHAGRAHDAAWIAEKIVRPTASDARSRMPSLDDKLPPEDVRLLADLLARRR